MTEGCVFMCAVLTRLRTPSYSLTNQMTGILSGGVTACRALNRAFFSSLLSIIAVNVRHSCSLLPSNPAVLHCLLDCRDSICPEITRVKVSPKEKSNLPIINRVRLVVQTWAEVHSPLFWIFTHQWRLMGVWLIGSRTGWGRVPPAKLEPCRPQRGNQGQIPAVYSRSLCQLLRKSEQMPPAGISRETWI